MVQDAEENAEKDKLLKAKIESRNKLESYLYNVKATSSEESVQNKLSPEERTILTEAISDGLEWLEATDLEQRSSEDLEEKQREVEAIVNPMMTRMYQASSAPAQGSGDDLSEDHNDSGGPTVEEVN